MRGQLSASMLKEFREVVMGLSETNTKRAMGSARMRPKSHWEAAGIGHIASLSFGVQKASFANR
jgi:hypothetical protein